MWREITRSIVRRERMGHIERDTSGSYLVFVAGLHLSCTLLSLSISDLEKVIYFAGYIVTSVNEEEKNRS